MDKLRTSSLKVASGVAIVLMLGAFTWGAWNARIKGSIESERDLEKLRSEELLSEKLHVEKNLASMEAQMNDLISKNEDLTRQIAEAGNLKNLKDQSIKQLERQLASNRKAYAQLTTANKDMEKKLQLLDLELAQVQEDRLASIRDKERLQAQVDQLKSELALAHNAYYDKVLVESTRGRKDKLVVKASRTRKLKATIVIPSALRNIQFNIFDPAGTMISSSPDNGVLAVSIKENNTAVASSSSSHDAQTFKQAEMQFLSKKKLSRGTYRIDVLSDNLLVGSLQVRLR